MLSEDLTTRLRMLRLLAMDVDGTLTDGGVYIFEDGREFRRFDIKDGLGLKAVQAAGIEVVWISAASGEAALHRARRLGIQAVHFGVPEKSALLKRLCQEKDLPLEQAAYIGDDLTDLEVMRCAGIAFAPCDAAGEVRQAAAVVTQASAGHGAVREVCDLILWSHQQHA
jgi:3-deoxy-D-manno-octulosonate 8-phosphate phosphatase (KDO 8-P phosphatase)